MTPSMCGVSDPVEHTTPFGLHALEYPARDRIFSIIDIGVEIPPAALATPHDALAAIPYRGGPRAGRGMSIGALEHLASSLHHRYGA